MLAAFRVMTIEKSRGMQQSGKKTGFSSLVQGFESHHFVLKMKRVVVVLFVHSEGAVRD